MFDVARDAEGLKQAIEGLLEEGFAYSRIALPLESSDDEGRDRLLRTLPERNLSEGYYKLGQYLLWLEQHLRSASIDLDKGEALEVDGLCVLSAARREFEHKHPPCGGCGALQDTRFVGSCHACGIEFRKRA